MQTLHLQQSATVPNCSRIDWSVDSDCLPNDIQKLILKYDITQIACSNHDYVFNATFSYSCSPETFSFDETNMLMQLMPDESVYFYLKAALREYMNAFIIFNSKGDRVYPEDII